MATRQSKRAKKPASGLVEPVPGVVSSPRGLPERLELCHLAPFLDFGGACGLSRVSRTLRSSLSSPEADAVVWRPHLRDAGSFGGYGRVLPEERRTTMEASAGLRAVCGGVRETACAGCGAPTFHFNLLARHRSCIECWSCVNSGPDGNDGASRFKMSSISLAKANFLLSDKELAGVHALVVNDATKAHGLISPHMKLVLVEEAKRLSYAKFGGAVELAAEKTRREMESLERWRARCAAAAEKPGAKRPARPKTAVSMNFVARNQRSIEMHAAAAEYGLYVLPPPAFQPFAGRFYLACAFAEGGAFQEAVRPAAYGSSGGALQVSDTALGILGLGGGEMRIKSIVEAGFYGNEPLDLYMKLTSLVRGTAVFSIHAPDGGYANACGQLTLSVTERDDVLTGSYVFSARPYNAFETTIWANEISAFRLVPPTAYPSSPPTRVGSDAWPLHGPFTPS